MRAYKRGVLLERGLKREEAYKRVSILDRGLIKLNRELTRTFTGWISSSRADLETL